MSKVSPLWPLSGEMELPSWHGAGIQTMPDDFRPHKARGRPALPLSKVYWSPHQTAGLVADLWNRAVGLCWTMFRSLRVRKHQRLCRVGIIDVPHCRPILEYQISRQALKPNGLMPGHDQLLTSHCHPSDHYFILGHFLFGLIQEARPLNSWCGASHTYLSQRHPYTSFPRFGMR